MLEAFKIVNSLPEKIERVINHDSIVPVPTMTLNTGTVTENCASVCHLRKCGRGDADVDVREQPGIEVPRKPVQGRRLQKHISKQIGHFNRRDNK